MSASSCSGTKSPRSAGRRSRARKKCMTSLEMPGEENVEDRRVHSPAAIEASSSSSRRPTSTRVLAVDVAEPGRQLDEAGAGPGGGTAAGRAPARRRRPRGRSPRPGARARAAGTAPPPGGRGAGCGRTAAPPPSRRGAGRCSRSTGQASGSSVNRGVGMLVTLPCSRSGTAAGTATEESACPWPWAEPRPVSSLTREEAEAAARSSTSSATTSPSTCAACSRARSSSRPRRSRSAATSPGAEHVRRLRGRGRAAPPSTASSSTSATVERGTASRCPTWPADNVLVVTSAQTDTGSGARRSCAPSTPPTSSSTSGPPSSPTRPAAPGPASTSPTSRRRTRFTVSAPETLDGHQQRRARRRSRTAPTAAGVWTLRRHAAAVDVRRRWSTPARSTSCASERGGYDLGLYCRQSLQAVPRARRRGAVRRSPQQGLAFFGERFGQPFPQERYDQVFVPNMGGAMENWGCVTWTDSVLFRSTPDLRPAGRRSPRSCCTRWRTCGSATW